MNVYGILTNDKEFYFYQTYYKNNSFQLIQLESNTDFQKIDKLIIPHQSLELLDLQIERLKLRASLNEWISQNKPLLTFGLATFYFSQGSKTANAFPVKLLVNKEKKNEWSKERIFYYPLKDALDVLVLTGIYVVEVSDEVEIKSKWKEAICAFRYEKSYGCLFIPTKETEKKIIQLFELEK